jgi:hypothetical protein
MPPYEAEPTHSPLLNIKVSESTVSPYSHSPLLIKYSLSYLESALRLRHPPVQILPRKLAHAHVQPLPPALQLLARLRLWVDARLRQRESQSNSRSPQLDWAETPGKRRKESDPTVRGKMTTSPCGPRSTRGSPSASRQVKGGKVTSCSPGYCHSKDLIQWDSAMVDPKTGCGTPIFKF